MKIYTLTLNPAYDVHATTAAFSVGTETLATVTSREAGGKGVNLSRALRSGGTDSTAIIVLGTDNGDEFKKGVRDAGITAQYLEKPGRIRENLTLHSCSGPETRISFAGFCAEDGILRQVLEAMSIDGDTIVTFTGRACAGISKEALLGFLSEIKSRGAKLVLDSKSLTLEDILQLQPWLIKPNREELSDYLGCPVQTICQARSQAQVFAQAGIENVMVSMGDQGALLLHKGQAYVAVPPKVSSVSTIGAGDSAIAGFLAGTVQEESACQCLKRAVAYGTAACLTEGTLPPRPEDIQKIYDQVEVDQ